MKQIKPPNLIPYDKMAHYVFLAGSIEMGKAENWQERVARELEDSRWTLLNPRRDDWDSSWEQSIKNYQFVQQVSWELEAMERAKYILMYFDPNTKSPISLLELGLFAKPDGLGNTTPSKLIVVCPEGFWRKGNVDVVCARYNIPQKTLEKAIKFLKEY